MKLSKSHYLLYLDSPRHLWAYTHGKIDSKQRDTFTEHLFEQGYEVQNYARPYVENHLIPNEYSNTSQFQFEITKSDNQFEVRVDLLIFNEASNNWDIYEIKSTNDIKPIHKKDLTYQYLVFKKHYEIGKCYVLHLNKEYRRRGELNIRKLFTRTDISEDVSELVEEVHSERHEALEVLAQSDYRQTIACIRPKTCPCMDLCHPDIPDYSIYEISRISSNKSRVRLLEQNYSKDIMDVPSDVELGKLALTTPQRKQVDAAQSGLVIVEKHRIQDELAKLQYPLYFLDYESFNPAIPMYDNYKAYDHMVFQYSLHIQEKPGAQYKHLEFIETEKVDPSVGLLAALRDAIGEEGSIIIWSHFERDQNNAMRERYPQFADFIDNMNSRLWDLMRIFSQWMYIDPGFRGSASIKKVLPVLVPSLSYSEMAIHDGAMAMTKWVQMVYGGGITVEDFSENQNEFSEPIDVPAETVDKARTRENLLRYCELDTWAMVKVLERVRGEMG